jgi:DNA repair protein RAD7
LGDLGSANVDNIIRSLSRHRTLTAENVQLFYGVQNKSLTLYDATSQLIFQRFILLLADFLPELLPPALQTLSMLNPNLTSLRLDFCGRMDSSVLDAWSTNLPSLTHLDLLGPFLVRAPAWINFFKSHPALESFRILQSPRFNAECMQTLAEHCTTLTSLRLKEVGLLSDAFLKNVASLEHLTSLDISDPAESCSEGALTDLIKDIGARLEELDLSGHIHLTDVFLSDALQGTGNKLMHLTLNNLPELTDAGVTQLFQTWRDAPGRPTLTSLALARNADLGERSLNALLACTGPTLSYLNIHGWRTTSEDALVAIGKRAHEVRRLDIGWNREVNDRVVKAIIDGCRRMEEIKCWGCNRITVNCPRKVRPLFRRVLRKSLMYACSAV